MRNNHVINLIEEKSFGSLSDVELEKISIHTEACENCLRAFEAARVSHSLMQERAAVAFEPSPFFHTRVLAALRERQATADAWGLGWLWRATGALASSMVATVVMLAVLTFVFPESQQLSSLSSNPYSAEEVILNQTSQVEEQSDSQLLTTIYGGDEESSR